MKIGPFTVTRDSLVLWLPVLVAVLTYLQNSPPPTQWTYADWMRILSAIVAAGSTKMMTSGLPGKNDPATINISKIAPVALLALALGASSCATTQQLSNARHVATVTVVSAHSVLATVQDAEALLVCGRSGAPAPPACVTIEAHRTISGHLATAFDLNVKVARLVRDAGSITPAEVPALVEQIAALVDQIVRLIPRSAQKEQLVTSLAAGGTR